MACYAITGGTGMIGMHLAKALRDRGDDVLIITRRVPHYDHEIQWDKNRGIAALHRLEGLRAVFNLTGAPIADRPWTKRRRQVLWNSRIAATDTILESLSRLDKGPEVFVGVGVLGVFGDRGDDILDEDEPSGTGFLADLAGAWQAAHLEADRVLNSRAAVLRMSIVLSHTGGAFPLMLRPFRYGIGGWLGNGRQFTSWISIRDTVGALLHLADKDECSGHFNGTTPNPIRNYEWCRALGHVLHRPVRTHAPKWALRGALGELADGIFLASVRAVPKKLLDSGYEFVDTDLVETFRWLIMQHQELSKK
ncbi:MAG: TIGR01777 family protein [Proteobacteria bacterium]|nr:TIGR01777 family protein [Pseudomonadota bacterium]